MDAEIGQAAGDVYQYLASNGPASAAQIKKATGHRDAVVAHAIGWLAREDKVVREGRGRATRWTLSRA